MRLPLSVVVCLIGASLLSAQEQRPNQYRPIIDKGLAWLVAQQALDGSWSDKGNNPTANTTFAGMALLADGNTLGTGKYSMNLRRAVHWLIAHRPLDAKYHGLFGDPNLPGSAGRYMMEHGVAMSFLGKLYGETEAPKERDALRKRLSRAVAFSVAGQSGHGGWFYASAIEGHNATENVATMLQLQGLVDARNAGIAVPQDTIMRAYRCLQRSTTPRGGIVYSVGHDGLGRPAGGERATITAMALAAFLPMNGQKDETTQRWLKFCAGTKFLAPDDLNRHLDLLPHYYFSKVVFHLDEDGTRALLPGRKIPDQLVWAKYRTMLFDLLQSKQAKDGSWSLGPWTYGPIMNTSLALNILLYEKAFAFPLSR